MHKSREWVAVEYEVLSKMHAVGKNDTEIGALLGRVDRDIRRARERMGLPGVRVGTPWSEADVACLHRLWENGISDKDIGERLGRTKEAISAKREMLGLVAPQRPVAWNAPKVTANEVLARPPLSPSERDYTRRAAASVAFLISLKRAGHKYGTGEFSIPSENRPVPHRYLVGA